MISHDPLFGEADMEDYANEQAKFRQGVDLLDSFGAGFEEGWYAGPTASILNYAYSQDGEKNLTGAEANEKYRLLEDNKFDEDQMVSENHARLVAERSIGRQMNELMAQQVKQDYGAVGSVMNFAGAMGAGFVDPINLATGVGTAMATAKFGYLARGKMFTDVVRNKTIGDVAAKNIAENFAITSLIEYTATPLGEIAFNQEITDEQKLMTIMGGTFFGGALGTVVDAGALRAARRSTMSYLRSQGSQASQAMEEATKKAVMDVENGIKPNPDHVIKVMEYDQYSARPNQNEYVFRELSQESTLGLSSSNAIKDQEWVIAKKYDDSNFDQVEVHGNGTITLVDDYNLAHNRVSSFKDTDVTGEVYKMKVNKKLNVLDSDAYLKNRVIIADDITKNIKDIVNLNKKQRSSLDAKIKRAYTETNNIVEFKSYLQEELGDIKGMPSIDDLVNQTLARKGFDGYHFVGSATTLNKRYNGITLFRPEAFKGSKKNSLYLGKSRDNKFYSNNARATEPVTDTPAYIPDVGVSGFQVRGKRPTVKESVASARSAKKETARAFYNRDLFERVYDAEATVPLNKMDPRTDAYVKPMQDLEIAEINRRNDPTQQLGYDAQAVERMNKAPNQPDEWDPALDFLDREKIELDQLKNMKNLDQETKSAIAKIENKTLVEDAYLDYVRCRGFNV